MPRPTLPFQSSFGGNLLFERVIAALGFDDSLMRRVVADSLHRYGATPTRVTPQDMGMLLPDIERKLVLIAGHDRAAPGLARLRRLLLCWDPADDSPAR
jgi:hypothetical protein